MTITRTMIDAMRRNLDLNADQSEVEATFLDTLGEGILESALLQFLAHKSEWEQTSFTDWVEAHAHEADFLRELITRYPEIGPLIVHEIETLQTNSAPTIVH